ncbi:MAG: UDP-N-acetylmuramate dehydrogenase [Candidatus Omnitrophota bacterium]
MSDEILKIKGRVITGERLSRHTTFGIGGPAWLWAEPIGLADLKKILKFSGKNKKKIFIIGSGSNLLVRDDGFDGIVVRLSDQAFTAISVENNRVRAGAGVKLGHLVIACCKASLGGLEGLAGIPGTVGGALVMNSGYAGNIGDHVKQVRVMGPDGRVSILAKKDLKFGYRTSNLNGRIVLEAEFSLKKTLKKKVIMRYESLMSEKKRRQPLDRKSAGCVFRNPAGQESGAGAIIEFCGLKGLRMGGAEVSRKHANFIINTNFATSKDVINLIESIQRAVKDKVNVVLKPEIVIL